MSAPASAAPPERPGSRWATWLLAVALAGPALLLLRGDAALGDKPFIDDAYYALSVARHLGLGHGVTFDGETLTNGFQPLYVFLIAPLYALTDGSRVGTLRAVIAVQHVAWIATVLGVMRLSALWQRARSPGAAGGSALIAGFLWCGCIYLFRHAFNGLETGLSLALVTWSLVRAATMDRTRTRSFVGLGGLLGLAVLARIDAAFLVTLLGLTELARVAPGTPAGTPAGTPTEPPRLLRAAAVCGVALAVSSPWWIYNVTVFGSLMPISGGVNQGSHLGNLPEMRQMLDAVATGFAPYLYAWRFDAAPIALLRLATAGVCVAAIARWVPVFARRATARRAGSVEWVFGAALVYIAVLAGWYMTQSRTSYFYSRYLVPAALIAVPVTSAALGARMQAVRAAKPIAIAAALLATAVAWAGPLASARGAGNAKYRDQLTLVREHVPGDALVAAWQSGTLGYYREGVVNLDGRVNPNMSFHYEWQPYLDELQVDWICEDAGYLEDEGPVGALPPPWRFVARSRRFELWTRAER